MSAARQSSPGKRSRHRAIISGDESTPVTAWPPSDQRGGDRHAGPAADVEHGAPRRQPGLEPVEPVAFHARALAAIGRPGARVTAVETDDPRRGVIGHAAFS